LILVLQVLPALAGEAGPPAVNLGPYVVSVEAVGRLLDLTQSPCNQAEAFISLSIEGKPEALGRLLEMAQEPEATDDRQKRLVFQEIRFPPPPAAEPGRKTAKIPVEVWFSGSDRSADGLESFSASLVSYEKKESLRLDFIQVAGEEPQSQNLDGLMITPTFTGRQESGGSAVYEVKLEVKASPEADSATQWRNEQVELIDVEGQPKAPLSTSRTYRYDESGKVIAKTITAAFALPARPPRGVRYRVERLRGVQTQSYRFENLPLP
jgi:hypothetical protein